MFWVRSKNGLCNLALATDVAVRPPSRDGGEYELVAYFPGGGLSMSILFAGTKPECEDRLESLATALAPTTVARLNPDHPQSPNY